MRLAIIILSVLVAIEHIWFMVLEMFLWTKPIGLKTFKMTAEKAEISKTLAQNQGFYNGIIAAGVIWALVAYLQSKGIGQLRFFFIAVIAAGLVGWLTTGNIRIFFVQSIPSIIALGLTFGVANQ